MTQQHAADPVHLEKLRTVLFELDMLLETRPDDIYAALTAVVDSLEFYIDDHEKQRPLEDEDLLARANALVVDVERFAEDNKKKKKYRAAISYLFNGAIAIGDIIDEESLGGQTR
ncbi:MAG: hypothetical protein ACXWQ5_00035 [Ktedonobacterales bacterium]